MKSILVPTDFSDSAEKALHFAIILAKESRSRILLMYVRTSVNPFNVLPEEVVQMGNAESERAARQNLHVLEGMIKYAGDIEYELITAEGSPAEVIADTALSRRVDLIVMGSGKRKTIGDFIFGGTATRVVGNAVRPVIVVPPEFHVADKISKISYATNFYYTDLKAIGFVADIARFLNAGLSVLHVSDERHEPEKEARQLNLFMKEINAAVNYSRMSCEILTGESAAGALGDYVDEGKTRLLVLSTRTRKTFSRVLGKSVTKELIRKSGVPVIVFRHQCEVQVTA